MLRLDKRETGHRIKVLRVDARMSQQDLSEATGINATTIARYETGEFMPGLDNAFLIAKALNCSIDDICALPDPSKRRACPACSGVS